MSSGEMMESNSPLSGAPTPPTARSEGEEDAEGRGLEESWLSFLSPDVRAVLVGENTAGPVPIGQASAVQTPPPHLAQ